ncbi:hypothetical protein HK102_012415, partial [Quaeritorhiza haematococci]
MRGLRQPTFHWERPFNTNPIATSTHIVNRYNPGSGFNLPSLGLGCADSAKEAPQAQELIVESSASESDLEPKRKRPRHLIQLNQSSCSQTQIETSPMLTHSCSNLASELVQAGLQSETVTLSKKKAAEDHGDNQLPMDSNLKTSTGRPAVTVTSRVMAASGIQSQTRPRPGGNAAIHQSATT